MLTATAEWQKFYLRAEPGTDLRALMDDVKASVDSINTFPQETERPRIFIPQSSNVFEVLSVAVTGRLSTHDLRDVAYQVRDDLLEIPGISRAKVEGDRPVEISIEADAKKLRSYNLSFQDLADANKKILDRPSCRSDR